jgi:hypothetical protein
MTPAPKFTRFLRAIGAIGMILGFVGSIYAVYSAFTARAALVRVGIETSSGVAVCILSVAGSLYCGGMLLWAFVVRARRGR